MTADHHKQPVAAIEQTIEPRRRKRGHFVSLVYWFCSAGPPPDESVRYLEGALQPGQWVWHEHCPCNLIPAQARYRRFRDA